MVEDGILGQDIPLGGRAVTLFVAGLGAYHKAGAISVGDCGGCTVVSAPQQEGIRRADCEFCGCIEVVPTHARKGIDPVEDDGHAMEARSP